MTFPSISPVFVLAAIFFIWYIPYRQKYATACNASAAAFKQMGCNLCVGGKLRHSFDKYGFAFY